MSLSLEHKIANLAFFSSLLLHEPNGKHKLYSVYGQIENVLWLQLGCQVGYFDPDHVGEVLGFLENRFVWACVAVVDSGDLDGFDGQPTRSLLESTASNHRLDRNLLHLSLTIDRPDLALASAFQNYALFAWEFTDDPRVISFLSALRFAPDFRWLEILTSGSTEDGLTPRDVVLAAISTLQFLDDMRMTKSGDQAFDVRVREIQRWKLDLANERLRQRFFDAALMVRDRTSERLTKTSQLEVANLIERQTRILASDWSGIEFDEEIEVEPPTQHRSSFGGKSEATEPEDLLERRIEELELSVRSYNSLKNLGINTISDLMNISRTEMQKRGVSRKSLSEIQEILAWMGLEWYVSGEKFAEEEHERPSAELEGSE
ncbi:MAG TPA: DNA-directed RNA polymerase subunit alpha C-terminal domain-containing protein [Candidatus Polarisedimenticolia bacterium]|nr:DNA-directed RNA polymerase subunit alpha C-terminal domain-containing protein [Candidatus Polarisedimenticolia bacterium]